MDLSLDAIRTGSVWVLVVIAAVAIVLAIVIKKIIGKIVVLLVAVALLIVGWQQRDKVLDFADGVRGSACAAEPSFLGIPVSLPQDWCTPTG